MSDIPKGTKCCYEDSIGRSGLVMVCDRVAKIVRNGAPYCKAHDPERKAGEEKRSARAAACVEALDGIENPKQFVADAMVLADFLHEFDVTVLDEARWKKARISQRRILAARDSAAGGGM